jgi:signal transduction histidine kinase
LYEYKAAFPVALYLRAMHNFFSNIYLKIVGGTISTNQEGAAKHTKHLLKICLISILILSLSVATLLVGVWLVERENYNGVSPLLPITLAACIAILLKVHTAISTFKIALFVITLLSLAGYYLSIGWGVDVPQSLLVYSLSIVICGMLLGARAIIILFCIHGFVLTSIAVLQANHLLTYQQEWKLEQVNFADGLAVTIMLAIIATASYIFNKQVETSEAMAANYLQQLTNERNLLEKEVFRRTEQLRTAHLDRIHQLNSLAELGKSSAHMLHDMAQPVTAAFLALDDIRQRSRSKTIRDQLELTNHALNQIEQYITAMRSTVRQSFTTKKCALRPILDRSCLLFSHQLRSEQIRLLIKCHQRLQFVGTSDSLVPILTNLIANSIDACKTTPPERRAILCSAYKTDTATILEVSDTGCGIAPSDVSLVFEPFYSKKKSDHNLGLGLSQVRDIVTNQLGGQIAVRSSLMSGTTFTITLPRS